MLGGLGPLELTEMTSVRQLVAKVDVPDISEVLENISILSTGTRLPITKSFKKITNVSFDLIEDGGSAINAEIIDYNSSFGPLIKGIDGNRNYVSATGTFKVQGF